MKHRADFYKISVSTILMIFFIISSCKDSRGIETEIPELNFKVANNNGFELPEGWQATLWAESPDLYNPTNMDVDVKGRVWVTEAVNYRGFNNSAEKRLSFEKGDRVMILEDTDGDGISDSSKVFVQDKDLVAPMGIAVIGNKVLVSCAPNLIVYTDENGDDIPDKKEVFLTGFGGFDHDHSLHSVAAGPDGNGISTLEMPVRIWLRTRQDGNFVLEVYMQEELRTTITIHRHKSVMTDVFG